MADKEDWTPASERAQDNLFGALTWSDRERPDIQAYQEYCGVAVVSDFIFVCRHYPDQVKKWLDEVKSIEEQKKRGEGPNIVPVKVGYNITGFSFPRHFWMILNRLWLCYPELDLTDIPAVHYIIKGDASTQAATAVDDFITLFRKELGDQAGNNVMALLDPFPGMDQWQRVAAIKMAELSVRQRQRKLARKPRRDALQDVVIAIVKEDPAITAPKLLARLRGDAGSGRVIEGVYDGSIEWTDGKKVRDTPAHAVKDRLSRAKKALGLTRRKSR